MLTQDDNTGIFDRDVMPHNTVEFKVSYGKHKPSNHEYKHEGVSQVWRYNV